MEINDMIKNPKRILAFMWARLFGWVNDETYLKVRCKLLLGSDFNLDNPHSFNEKINWLKIHNRNQLYPTLVDKYTVKEYVAYQIGAMHVIPTYGVWESFDSIDFDSLPEQFVLKSTNGGGGTGVIICRDKNKLNKDAAKKSLLQSMKNNGRIGREWPYQFIKPRIIAEKLMVSSQEGGIADLADYKFYCFNGEPVYCQVIRDRNTKESIDFYDMDWKHQEFTGLTIGAIRGDTPVERPSKLEDMKAICRKLSNGQPFFRIDLYVIDNNIYFGEITLFPNAGIGTFTPSSWNQKFGELLNIENIIINS